MPDCASPSTKRRRHPISPATSRSARLPTSPCCAKLRRRWASSRLTSVCKRPPHQEIASKRAHEFPGRAGNSSTFVTLAESSARGLKRELDDALDHARITPASLERGLRELVVAVEVRVRIGFENDDFAFRRDPEIDTAVAADAQRPIDRFADFHDTHL